MVGSPFDYENSTLVYIPTDMPDPNRRDDYQRAVERGLIELAAATEGGMLGLFTSYAQLRQTAQSDRAPAGARQYHRLRSERRHQPPGVCWTVSADGTGRAARHALVLGRRRYSRRRI